MGSEVENDAHAKKLTDLVSTQLGVRPPRVQIHFEELKPHDVAKNGVTVRLNSYRTANQ